MSSENSPRDHDRGPDRDPHAEEEQHAGRDRRAARLRRHARTRRAVSTRVVVGAPEAEDEAGAAAAEGTTLPGTEEVTGSGSPEARPDGDVGPDAGGADAEVGDAEDADAADAGSGAAPETSPGSAGAGSSAGRGALRRGLAGLTAQLPRSRSGRVLAGLLVVATATTGVLGWRAFEARAVDQAREGAQSAAQDSVANVLSYDHRRIGKDFDQARTGLTDSFGAKYAKSEDVVGPPARKYEVTVKANVVESSVVQATPDRVVLLLYVNQETTSDRLDGPRVDLARVRVTMADEDGWKVDDLDAL